MTHLGLGLLPPVWPFLHSPCPQILGPPWGEEGVQSALRQETPGPGQWALSPGDLGRKGVSPHCRPAAPTLADSRCKDYRISEVSERNPHFVSELSSYCTPYSECVPVFPSAIDQGAGRGPSMPRTPPLCHPGVYTIKLPTLKAESPTSCQLVLITAYCGHT